MRILLTLISICLFLTSQAQSTQAEYLEAKRQYTLGNYAASKLAFGALSTDKMFGVYSSFYYALSAYKNGETKLAYDMWKQISINNGSWAQIDEVNYWLANLSFELKNFDAGFSYFQSLPGDLQELTIQESLENLPVSELVAAFEANQENESLAAFLLQSLNEQPYTERDFELIAQIAEKFDFERSTSVSGLPEVKKNKYSIAAVLPFMYEGLETPQTVLRNAIIWDLYEGMKLAKVELEEAGIEVELFPYDTRKSEQVTNSIVETGALKDVDVIVGPLYAGPNRVISAYSDNQEITVLNPLSSNGAIISNNPYAYLFSPSYETQGKLAAQFATENFTGNKKAFVFYETDRDSILAKAYLDEIEANEFFAIRFERLTNESAQEIENSFIEKYEVRLDDQFTATEIDSIRLLPGRLVKSKPLRNQKTGSLIRDQEGNPVNMIYEERFNVTEDSIGHMLVATSSNLLANHFIGISEVRNDSIKIIGYESWLDFPTISYKQLERLDISFISPTAFNSDNENYKRVHDKFIEKIGREPGEFHLRGYELLYQLGLLLDENGKYFQRGLGSNELIEGKVMYGLQFGPFKDNQVVPITKLENFKVVNLSNRKAEEVDKD